MMKFLRFFYSSTTLLVLLFLSPALLQTGCGGEEKEQVEEVEAVDCEEDVSGNIEVGEDLRSEHEIASIDYDLGSVDREMKLVMRDGDDNSQAEMDFDISRTTESMFGLDLDYKKDGEEVAMRVDATLLSSPPVTGQINPRVGLLTSMEWKGKRVGTQMLVEPTGVTLNDADAENPALDVIGAQFFVESLDGSGRVILDLMGGGEALVDEDDVESWAAQHLTEGWAEDAPLEEIFGILSEQSLHERIQELYESCRTAARSSVTSQALTPCERQAERIDLVGNVFMQMTVGTITAPFKVLSFGAFMLPVADRDPQGIYEGILGSLAGAILVGFGVWAGASVGLAVGIALASIVVVFALWVTFEIIYTAVMGCGNPLMMPLNRRSFPFRDTGEYDWYSHRARDALRIQTRQLANPRSTCADGRRIAAVAVGSEEHRVGIYADRDSPLWIDGEPQQSGHFWRLDDGTTVERRTIGTEAEETYYVEGVGGERLRVDVFGNRLDLELEHLAEERVEGARGLIGNHKVDGVDGLLLRDGRLLTEPVDRRDLYLEFGNSWRVDPEESLFDYVAGEGPQDYAESSYPMEPRTLEGLSDEDRNFARQVCQNNAGITNPTLLRHCMLDVGCTGDVSYMHTYSRLNGPGEELQIIDESGSYISGRIGDDSDLFGGASVGGPGSSGGPDFETAQQATCPADIESSAESIGYGQMRTIDGLPYDFRAIGEFVLVESRANDSLAVHVRQESTGGAVCPYARKNTAVAAQVGDRRIAFYADADNPIHIDGEPSELAGGFEVFDGGHTVLEVEEGAYLIEWPDRSWLHVEFEEDRLDIKFNSHYTRLGQLQGLFGQFNGYPENDIAMRSGATLDEWDPQILHAEYADSWRISQGESLLDYEDGESTADFTDTSVPAMYMTVADVPATDESEARTACEDAGVSHPEIMKACILDVYCSGDPSVADDHADREEPQEKEWVDLVPGSGDYCCHVDCIGGPDDECGFVCGTGEFEASHEWCDGDCPSSDLDCVDQDPADACTESVLETAFPDAQISAYICASRCVQREQLECEDGNGCCPTGGQCTSVTDNDCDIVPNVGSGCVEDEHCATLGADAPDPSAVHCVDEEDKRMFGGFCSLDCQNDGECPEDTHCATEVLHTGNAAGSSSDAVVNNLCVPSCDSDADCEREGYGCYDANQDGRSECWHIGTGDQDYGDSCSLSRDCGEIGQWATCANEDGFFNEFVEGDSTMCTARCDIGDAQCPAGWECDPGMGLCVEPIKNEIGNACEDESGCNSAEHNPRYRDRCFDEGDDHSLSMQGGYCTYSCESDAECPDGARCAAADGLYDDTGKGIFTGDGYCVSECSTDADCPREGYGCFDANFDGVNECWHLGTGPADYGESCEFGSDCGGVGEQAICRKSYNEDQTVVPGSGECSRYCGFDEDICPEDWQCGSFELGLVDACVEEVANEEIGNACNSEDDCGEAPEGTSLNVTCHNGGPGTGLTSTPGGYCSLTGCQSDSDCGGGAECFSVIGENPLYGQFGSPSGSMCALSCDSNADCPRADYECYDASGDGRNVCWHVGNGPGGYGDVCDDVTDCGVGEGAVCRLHGGTESRCTTTCDLDEQNCPTGFGCDFMNICAEICEDSDDCSEYASCISDAITYEDGSTDSGCM